MNSKISMYGNKRMLLSVIALGCCIFALWYFFHPLSPYNERIRYVGAFTEVGPTGSGNNVKVGGLPKGRILKMQKTDSCIYVTFEIVKSIRLPIDSKFTFATAGFLGNREIRVDLGTSKEFFNAGDTVSRTYFDKGLNTARADLDSALLEFKAVMEQVNALLDTLKKGDDKKQLDRIVRKGKNLMATASNDISSWKSEAEKIISDLSGAVEKLKSTTEKIATDAETLKANGKDVLDNLTQLKNSAEAAKSEVQSVLAKLNANDNSAGLILQKGGELSTHLEQIAKDVDALIQDVKKNGVKLNVDIF